MKHEGAPEGAAVPTDDTGGQSGPGDRFDRHRLGGLSGKLLLLTVLFVMLSEVFIYVPSIANYRNTWLMDRLTTAGVAASVLAETSTIAPRLQEELLQTTGAVAISLDQGSRRSLIAMNDVPGEVDFVVDMANVSAWSSIIGSFQILTYRGDGVMRVVGVGQMGHTERVDVVLPVELLQQDMLAFSGRILALSLFISVITAGLVYITLRALFIRPLRRLTRSMERFAENPEDTSRIVTVSGRQDELGDAEIRLAAMEEALSRALHQKQRLADLGLAVSKINHDLRNLLASAQLFLERLEHVPDPTVSRLAPKILATLDRAVGYTQAVMSYGKAQERPPQRRLLALQRVGDDVADVLGLVDHETVAFENRVPDHIEIDADPEQIFRVLLNLVRNALQALEAEKDETLVRRISMDAMREGDCVHVMISDTGPGIPGNIRKALFKAFHSGSKKGGVGLGLAIVAELLKAHGGSIHLDESKPGACFRLKVPDRSS
ncbi:sensor histidine kinase [Roseibium album]|uniref:sensor histidine kinase n=1 Tax=Roseibium album TaxID=311410 RepID=UPI000CF07DEB|nr:HAMP domain-containing sensor histidine kinase [Roseibium album]MBG6145904.1 signal transduction histidine kinase [Labrenzia sp. EL_142]MBG6162029.1 signal transduction histidine kinase [Labrenzia sp. EL_195]MCR9058311.1 HAMP domain-containing histidine kinase [Paracoccaceae bacterium]